MSDDTASWPDTLRRLSDVIGTEAALKLADRYGGLSGCYVPQQATPRHRWAVLLGHEAFQKLCAEFGGQRIYVARGTFRQLKKRAILDLADAGLSHRDIAVRTRSSEFYVRQVLGQLSRTSD